MAKELFDFLGATGGHQKMSSFLALQGHAGVIVSNYASENHRSFPESSSILLAVSQEHKSVGPLLPIATNDAAGSSDDVADGSADDVLVAADRAATDRAALEASADPGDIGWVLRRPLQLESMRRRMPETPRTHELLRKLHHARENLDAVVYALSSRELADDRRSHLLDILARHQEALDETLGEFGVAPRPGDRDPLWHYHQLDPATRKHLAAILGVPEEPAFYPVLEIKAEEYLAQLQAFDAITEEAGFRERPRLSTAARRGAVALTLSGSLIQISAPSPEGSRRYLYQNIYGNAHPPEGVLVLDRDVEVGERIRSVELTTSPVRELRVAGRRMSWKAQSHTFERLSRTFTSLASRSSSDLAVAALGAVGQARFNPEAAERVLRQECGESFESFERLRYFWNSGETAARERDEAELLTLCLFLQTAARELGFQARSFAEADEVVTVDGKRYAIDADRRQITRLPSGGGGLEVVYVDVSLGRQLFTSRAPIALIGADGKLLDVIGPVAYSR
ncbi:MAG: hypothetical protein KC503_25570 [Myxococcales bacterium]|nr:hypothetical protein [Myxococcales bacterium]